MEKEIKEYLAWKATHHYPASVAYKKSLTRFVECCGEKGIREYTIQDVVQYTNMLAAKFANETVRYSLTILKNFFTYYKELKYDCLSTKLIQLPKKLPANSHRALTPEEFERIFSCSSQETFMALRDLCIVCMLWDTGVRVSELRGFNREEMNMTIGRSDTPTRKTSDARIIMWSERANAVLIRYSCLYGLQNIEKGKNGQHPLFVNLSRNGWHKRLTTRSIERIVALLGKRAGIVRPVKPHMFRHGWAHVRRDAGAPLSFIQKGLGHRSPVSTQTYVQFNDPEFVKAAQHYLSYPQTGITTVAIPHFVAATR